MKKIFIIMGFILSGIVMSSVPAAAQGHPGERPMPVTVEKARTQNVTITQDYPARLFGARQVEVRARVEGIIEERLYEEGAAVEQHQALFRIDPRPFAVAEMTARAERNTAQAELEQARREWERAQRLFEQEAISTREKDSAKSAHDLAKAQLEAAEARLEQAAIALSYTAVTAPLAGTTSLEALPEGSLVQPGTLLTVITQQDPVHARLALPTTDYTAMNRTPDTRYAEIILADGQIYPVKGELDFTARTIDPATGTVQARAIFKNPDHELIPGQFVRVRLVTQELENVITVPETVIGQGRQGRRVFIVQDGKAVERPVRTGPLTAGQRVILEGLAPDDLVVISGHVALRDGAPVQHEGQDQNQGRNETAPGTNTE